MENGEGQRAGEWGVDAAAWDKYRHGGRRTRDMLRKPSQSVLFMPSLPTKGQMFLPPYLAGRATRGARDGQLGLVSRTLPTSLPPPHVPHVAAACGQAHGISDTPRTPLPKQLRVVKLTEPVACLWHTEDRGPPHRVAGPRHNISGTPRTTPSLVLWAGPRRVVCLCVSTYQSSPERRKASNSVSVGTPPPSSAESLWYLQHRRARARTVCMQQQRGGAGRGGAGRGGYGTARAPCALFAACFAVCGILIGHVVLFLRTRARSTSREPAAAAAARRVVAWWRVSLAVVRTRGGARSARRTK